MAPVDPEGLWLLPNEFKGSYGTLFDSSGRIEAIGGRNTLKMFFVQQSLYRHAGRQTGRPVIVRVPMTLLSGALLLVLRLANNVAWTLNQRDSDSCRFSLGFLVVAGK